MITFNVALILMLVQCVVLASLDGNKPIRISKRSLPRNEQMTPGHAEQPVVCGPMEYYDQVVDRCERCDELCRTPFSDTCYVHCADYMRSLIAVDQLLSKGNLQNTTTPPGVYPTTTNGTSAEPIREPATEQPLVEKPLFWTSVVSLLVAVVATIVIIVLCVMRKNSNYRPMSTWCYRGREGIRLVNDKKMQKHEEPSIEGTNQLLEVTPVVQFSMESRTQSQQQQRRQGQDIDNVSPICNFVEADTGSSSNVRADANKNTPSLHTDLKSKRASQKPQAAPTIPGWNQKKLLKKVEIREMTKPTDIHNMHVTDIKQLAPTSSPFRQPERITANNFMTTMPNMQNDSKIQQSPDISFNEPETQQKLCDTGNGVSDVRPGNEPMTSCQSSITEHAGIVDNLGIREKDQVAGQQPDMCTGQNDQGFSSS